MMRYGIPAYRLPREVLSSELERIATLGVRMTGGHRVEDLDAERRDGAFDAVFVAVGAHLPSASKSRHTTRGGSWTRCRSCAAWPRASGPRSGGAFAVYGGGNTAMDAARTARRLGADEALIVYRRTRAQMPAHEEEAEDAEREGVHINWLRTITAFDGPTLTVEAMELDESGFSPAHGALRGARRRHGHPRLRPGDRQHFPEDRPRGRVHPGRHGGGVGLDDDGLPRGVRRRGHGAGRAHGDRRCRAREKGRPAHRRLVRGAAVPEAPKHEWPPSTC